MKRILLASLAVLALAACDQKSFEGPPIEASLIPEGLKDCKFYNLQRGSGQTYHVVRCPNSSTSLSVPGKHAEYTTTIDGQAAPAAPVSSEDARKAAYDALLAKINAEIKRLELRAAELERERLK